MEISFWTTCTLGVASTRWFSFGIILTLSWPEGISSTSCVGRSCSWKFPRCKKEKDCENENKCQWRCKMTKIPKAFLFEGDYENAKWEKFQRLFLLMVSRWPQCSLEGLQPGFHWRGSSCTWCCASPVHRDHYDDGDGGGGGEVMFKKGSSAKKRYKGATWIYPIYLSFNHKIFATTYCIRNAWLFNQTELAFSIKKNFCSIPENEFLKYFLRGILI